MRRPTTAEYVPAAANYVALVLDGDFLDLLDNNRSTVIDFFSNIPVEKELYRYQPGKWTPKEMLLHLADTERVFAYRALTIARGDTGAIFPNMDQQLFASNTDPSPRPMADLVREFAAVRDASGFLFKHLSDRQFAATGKLFGYPVTPLGFGYCIIGHAVHHLNVLRDRYLG